MRNCFTYLIVSVCISDWAFAQSGDGHGQNNPRMGGSITGILLDADQQSPLSYANVVLYRTQDSSQVSGTASNAEGAFEILKVRPGRYYLRVYYMGYEIKSVNDISLRQGAMRLDLGTIALAQSTLIADEVEVTAGRLPLTYQVDKKVINVAEYQTAVSGNAVDILEKVPSVNVDVDGNVSLRGSSNFTVLIDGRPSVLEASEALQQIPAGTIENIEIITNPSAKYNPAGTSGIINIQLKKTKQTGRSGMVNINAGATDRHGADVTIEQRNSSYAANLAVDYNRHFMDGSEEELFTTTQESSTSTVSSQGDLRRGRTSFGVRGGLDFFPGTHHQFGIGGRIGLGEFGRSGRLNYMETDGVQSSEYVSSNERGRELRFYAMNASYQYRIQPKDHRITSDWFFSRRTGASHTEDELRTSSDIQSSGRKSTEDGPSNSFRWKLDYLYGPEALRLESGYQYEVDFSNDKTATLEYDSLTANYVSNPLYEHSTDFVHGIHAMYSMLSGKSGPFSYQGGLRVEYTDRRIGFDSLPTLDLTRWDLYPTVHGTFEISPTMQGMASYTRRTERPRAWYLEPYEIWIDAYNIRKGNPSLKQEFIDSYEAGLQKNFGKVMLSLEGYYRVTHNKVERVQSAYADNVTLQSVENIGTDYAFGSEGLLSAEMSKVFSTNVTANAYQYRVKGRLFEEPFSRSSFNWSLRMNNTIRPVHRLTLQIDGQYESESTEAQGREEASYLINAALRYDIIPKQFIATLQVRDVFGTYRHKESSEGPGYYRRELSTREAPLLMLNLRYIFNNFKPERQQRNRGEGMDEEDF